MKSTENSRFTLNVVYKSTVTKTNGAIPTKHSENKKWKTNHIILTITDIILKERKALWDVEIMPFASTH